MANSIKETYTTLRDTYLKYINTGLALKDHKLNDERNILYEEDEVISQSPIIELVPKYESYSTLEEVLKELNLDSEFADFADFGLFKKKYQLYTHQYKSIKDVLVNKKNLVVTTGTGSGKTECFLIPLIYNLFSEIKNKKAQKKPAIRSLILYPLNALAEDQMIRLRKAVNSGESLEETGAWTYLKKRYNSKITFGRYTGSTENCPQRNIPNVIRNLKKEWKEAMKSSQDNKKLLYMLPSMKEDSSEMWHRKHMQDSPPDILITNYSMLSIMLNRSMEESIWSKTKHWLQEDENNIFHFVVDELHTYRGTSGSEVAYLIRLLYSRLGLAPNSPQLRILASSASMQEGIKASEFLAQFYALDKNYIQSNFSIVKDERTSVKPKNKNLERFLKFFEDESGQTLPKSIKALSNQSDAKDDNQTYKILEELSTTKKDNNPIQPVRAHLFFKNIDGLYACSNKDCTEVDKKWRYGERLIGKLYRSPKSICGCGALILEVLFCRNCGEVYLGGRKDDQTGQIHLEDGLHKGTYLTVYNKGMTHIDYPNGLPSHWKIRSFNHLNGDLRQGQGATVFIPDTDYGVLHPDHCLSCDLSDSISDKNTFTSISRHYTGVQKINQVLADALFSVLRKNNQEEGSPKLVLFSDSRQAAAKLSAGIELDHYRDLLRQKLIEYLKERRHIEALLKAYVEADAKVFNLDDQINKEIALKRQNDPYFKSILSTIRDKKDWGEQVDLFELAQVPKKSVKVLG